MEKSESITELAKALSALQSGLKPVPKDATNPFFKSKYADLSGIWESSRGLIGKHGFSVSQLPQVKDGQIVLTTLLMHTSGEWLASDLLVTPVKQNDPQSVGSALTYARRYALSAILGICSEEDDDAEGAMNRNVAKSVTTQQPPVKASTIPAATPSPADFTNGGEKGPLGPIGAGFANAGEFLTACAKNLKLNKTKVISALFQLGIKVPENFEGVNLDDAYQFLKDAQNER